MNYYEHLESFKSSEGYWFDPIYIDVAAEIVELTGAKSMLEIGFNIGHSAAAWLHTPVETLHIVDIGRHQDTRPALEATHNHFSSKEIDWLIADSADESTWEWATFSVDLGFVDGAHDKVHVENDIRLCQQTQAKWIVIDDMTPNAIVANSVQPFVEDGTLELVKTWTPLKNTVCLFKVQN